MDTILNDIKPIFLNKKIVDMRYLTKEEAEMLGWVKRSVVFQLDDGTFFFPSKDDEGNDAGALFFNTDGVIPVIDND